ncbi:hypothetical protein QCA50_018913 [Cerrena zonata]|uniref:DUF6532 domain-containing protein n=1 Tax=Cerrena zonata TaxID=2478898 RepID=A0AAW0FA83_9APHY
MPPPPRTESYNALSPVSKRARMRAERKVEEAAKDQQLIEAGSGTRPSKTKLLVDPTWLKAHGTKRGRKKDSDEDSDGSDKGDEDTDRSTPKKSRKKLRGSHPQPPPSQDQPKKGAKRPARSMTPDRSEDEQCPPKKQKRPKKPQTQSQLESNQGKGDNEATSHDKVGAAAMSPSSRRKPTRRFDTDSDSEHPNPTSSGTNTGLHASTTTTSPDKTVQATPHPSPPTQPPQSTHHRAFSQAMIQSQPNPKVEHVSVPSRSKSLEYNDGDRHERNDRADHDGNQGKKGKKIRILQRKVESESESGEERDDEDEDGGELTKLFPGDSEDSETGEDQVENVPMRQLVKERVKIPPRKRNTPSPLHDIDRTLPEDSSEDNEPEQHRRKQKGKQRAAEDEDDNKDGDNGDKDEDDGDKDEDNSDKDKDDSDKDEDNNNNMGKPRKKHSQRRSEKQSASKQAKQSISKPTNQPASSKATSSTASHLQLNPAASQSKSAGCSQSKSKKLAIEKDATVEAVPVAPQWKWPQDTDLHRDGTHLNISTSPNRMKPIMITACKLATLDCILRNAYAEYPQRLQYLRDLLRDAAREHDDDVVADRVANDHAYFSIFKTLPEQRFSVVRSKVKPPLQACVPRLYHLKTGCDKLVKKWRANKRYIYPSDSPSEINTKYPYQSPAIIQGLTAVFFTGSKSFVATNLKHFEVKHGRRVVFEVTRAMVALIATGIDSVLSDWETGVQKATHFTSTFAHPVYLSHIKMLVQIENKKPGSYHTMMATLFDEASDGQAFIANVNDEEEDLELIDWDAMPEDPVSEDPVSE